MTIAARESIPGPVRLPSPAVFLRLLLPLIGLAGAVLVALSSFASIVEIDVLTTNELATDLDTRLTGLDRHGPALLVIAAFAVLMLFGAVGRGARPAMLAVAVAGAVTLGIAGFSDGPSLDDTGQVGQLYEDASAKAGTGFYFETLGGVLLLLSGGGMLLAGTGSRERGQREPREPRVRRRDRSSAEAADETTPAAPVAPRAADDWFGDGPA